MKVYCMSDIHGCKAEFEEALSLVLPHLDEPNTKLCLLGDYIHIGYDSYGVLDRVIELQNRYGEDKVIALMGNHEEFVLDGYSTINCDAISYEGDYYDKEDDLDKYISWINKLPLYHTEGNTIFVHAGIDEEAGDLWEHGTGEHIFVGKYPADIGKIPDLDMKVVAGHIGTYEISKDPRFHDIYYDGKSHYYIDGTVVESRVIPVLMVDTEEDKYYRVTESGCYEIMPYGQED